ncbi:ArsR/SmtB family transcription factor [Actinacidiphila glaucinigra]
MCHQAGDAACTGQCLQLSAADALWWAHLFKTLGDPVRLRLLAQLAAQQGAELPVHELGDVGVSLSTVSHHLKRLRCAGLIQGRRQGRVVFYRMNEEAHAALLRIAHLPGPPSRPLGRPHASGGEQGSGPAPQWANHRGTGPDMGPGALSTACSGAPVSAAADTPRQPQRPRTAV